jgi:hypothetical protein
MEVVCVKGDHLSRQRCVYIVFFDVGKLSRVKIGVWIF